MGFICEIIVALELLFIIIILVREFIHDLKVSREISNNQERFKNGMSL